VVFINIQHFMHSVLLSAHSTTCCQHFGWTMLLCHFIDTYL